MIGRFGMSSPASKDASNAGSQPPSQSSSMPSMSMNMNFMKKMSAGLSMPTIDTTAMMASMATISTDKKAKTEQEERKTKIAQTVAILEDVHLQSPPNHSGMIVAYTAKNMSPIVHPGVKFRWYRLPAGGSMQQVEESHRAWYAPTVDDIGCMICAQCEDTFEQGFSKYLECGPIKADPLLTSISESAISNGVFEVKNVSVSLGLSLSSYTAHGEHETLSPAQTALARDSAAFLQLNGLSSVEVDAQGVFVSIPTESTHNGNSAKGKAALNTARRGLRIPASPLLRVSCVQPAFLVLTLPVTRKASPSPSPSPPLLGDEDSETSAAPADEEMQQFLSSSILSIPWTYEGHHLTPAAYIADSPSTTDSEEREREAEEDAAVFAQTVVSLAEFVSSVPQGEDELSLCFACDSRLHRDALALAVRALAAQQCDAAQRDRRRALPWHTERETHTLTETETETQNGSETSDSYSELTQRLRAVEEESAALKRERNELAKQLLHAKDELARRGAQSEEKTLSPAADEKEREGERELSAKVIELENKINILNQRESDANKARNDLELKCDKQQRELDRLKALSDDLLSKTNRLQALLDQKTASIALLEGDQERNAALCAEYEEKVKDMEKLKKEIAQRDSRITELSTRATEENSAVEDLKVSLREKDATIEELRKKLAAEEKKQSVMTQHFDTRLSASVVENQRLERELAVLQDRVQTMESALSSQKSLEAELLAAQDKANNLVSEMNHLQKRSESQTKDMKKMMRENSQTLLEFERALARKNGECTELSFEVEELKNRIAWMQGSGSPSPVHGDGGLFGKLSSTINSQRASFSVADGAAAAGAATLSSTAANMLRRLSVSSRNDFPDNSSTTGDS